MDPSKDRWGADDVKLMMFRLVRSEGPGIVESARKGDNDIRAWVARTELVPLGLQPTSEKIRMLNTLIDGWVSEDDMVAIGKILRSVTSRTEMVAIRGALASRELDFTDVGQRTLFRVALARTP